MPAHNVDAEAHAERVITMHILTTDELVIHNREKLARAIQYLGHKWLLSPAQHVARVAHEKRDGLALFVASAGAAPFLVMDVVAKVTT